MKVMFDLNVLLDVLQMRRPWVQASGALCAKAVRKDLEGVIAAHALTTLFYILRKYAGPEVAKRDIDWLLGSFSIAPADKVVFLRARTLAMADFEDAVIAASAESCRCDFILTRNLQDFAGSPIPALSPEEAIADGRFYP